ncbi:MAG TPA: peroxide stress protein YaaA [Nocardioidaceae bacterium]|nr:peroxide stress protein YaaA [Nocardioidaceae bacterium]
MLILLPPSEGKTEPRRGRPLDLAGLSFPSLHRPRAEVADALVHLCTSCRADAAGVLGLGATQVGEVDRNARLASAPAARADRVYSGVLYSALDLPTLDATARRRAASWLATTSGLFGLLRPSDRIPAYRLSGSVSLPGVGALTAFWRGHLDEAVREAARHGLIVDLRSSPYASFWRPDRELARRVVTVRVLQDKDGRRSVVSHFNKATKGRLVRSMLTDGAAPSTPDQLADQLAVLGWRAELADHTLDVVVDQP